ncbi:MAG: excinuclease ABC subunit UvrA [Polyangiaceae bacterium]|nr:excinuclease ABC subunit UvrA [Polyangiaceae bacterium]
MHPISVERAWTHNLKGVSLRLEPGTVVVFTGVSSAGKSSLALDTLYAEGQRRFVESFSPYARQFLERLERPPVDRLEPIAAAIAVDRSAPVKSSRSTVATMADLEPYLAALFTREAQPVCPVHDAEGVALDVAGAVGRALGLGVDRAVLTHPLHVRSAEHYLEVRDNLAHDGYRRVWLAGQAREIDTVKPSEVLGPELEVVLDRVKLAAVDASRLAQAIEQGWQRGKGVVHVHTPSRDLLLRQGISCPECARPLEPPRAGLFSYESPLGACPECRGFGRTIGIDFQKVIPDPELTLKKRAIRPWAGKSTTWERAELAKLCRRHDIPMDVPWNQLAAGHKRLVIDGDGSFDAGLFPGVQGWFQWLETRTYKMHVRVLLSRYRAYELCTECQGQRLNPTALSYRVGGQTLAEWHALEVGLARTALDAISPKTGQGALAKSELATRLAYLERVGLSYLTLDRQARTLSGGEAQRVTLTRALGTSLHNALFVLDEPTVGLHPSDVAPLAQILGELALRNNVVVVVEHDPALILAADRVVELGPGAGPAGGHITARGSLAEVTATGGATARALAGVGEARASGREPSGWLCIHGASENNLRDVSVEVPLGVLTAVTGPSGSGKSTLAVDVLYRALGRHFRLKDVPAPGRHQRIDGLQVLRRAVLVDQSPLGRTSRGNAATYTKAWDVLRALYAAEPEAQARGLSASHFSFNVAGGRCDACAGEGYETVEMQFLADVRLSCPVCKGRRFQEVVLEVRHRGRSIAELLEATVDDVLQSYAAVAAINRALGPAKKLGLGYLVIGQPLSTLSGGEAQRLKLARALGDDNRGAVYVLDEPSAGLHADEVAHLLAACDAILAGGGSVVAVDHDPELIARADHIIDLGPGAGRAGGRVVFTGSPEQALAADTLTADALRARATRALPAAKPSRGEPARAAIEVVRAREHNLREVSVRVPHQALTVVTGPSGSGKSTLAFDVIFAEGQRRFVETLTPYARQFLPTLPRPDVDSVSGVPPSVALEQRTARAGGRSTVATVTEVAHYLRLLFAKLGTPHCPSHDKPITTTSRDALRARCAASRSRRELLAPVVRARKGLYLDVFTAAARDGIELAYCDGELVATDTPPRLSRSREHTIDLVMANLSPTTAPEPEVFERALRWGAGSIKLRDAKGREELLSTISACPDCGLSIPELDPRWFSFNTLQGQCERCQGEGVVSRVRRQRGRQSKAVEVFELCSTCAGARLAPIPRAVRLLGSGYPEVVSKSVGALRRELRKWRFAGRAAEVAKPILRELERRLEFLDDVGLDYLSLDRSAKTLSGGEMQRLRLAAQLGTGLTGALYVLDEPTIGLHARDTGRLLRNLRRLVDTGSTVLVVEHDAETIAAADWLVDLGPEGGSRGGQVIAQGPPAQVLGNHDSPTGRALSSAPVLRRGRPIPAAHPRVLLTGANAHNLRDVEVGFPVGRLTVVAGVSGSGKSTLVRQVLLPALRERLGLVTEPPLGRFSVSLAGAIERAVAVDQSPIGRTPRSVPATFLGIWDVIRKLLALSPDAQVLGFDAARFSFNTPRGGRCPACEGQGVTTHEMSFLPDVVTPCAVCEGHRFEPQTLGVRLLGLSAAELLELTAERGAEVFRNHPQVSGPLRTLVDLGAGYIRLGQGSHTLSGGEAQRLKLAAELTATARHQPTLYVLDEPTTGLHVADVQKLVTVLDRLVERGDTLVVIEHHPEVIAGADWVIELGPEGGDGGGRVVAQGPPGVVAKRKTATGVVLARLLGAGAATRAVGDASASVPAAPRARRA